MIIYQPSDLAGQKRTSFMDEARAGRAVIRHKDGTNIVALPQVQLDLLEGLAAWSQAHAKLSRLLLAGAELNVENLGELAWLRSFDRADIEEFAEDIHMALIASLADGTLRVLEDCVRDWKTTAGQLEDPLRRTVLLNDTVLGSDFDDAERPEALPKSND
jgi:hypothetical protein